MSDRGQQKPHSLAEILEADETQLRDWSAQGEDFELDGPAERLVLALGAMEKQPWYAPFAEGWRSLVSLPLRHPWACSMGMLVGLLCFSGTGWWFSLPTTTTDQLSVDAASPLRGSMRSAGIPEPSQPWLISKGFPLQMFHAHRMNTKGSLSHTTAKPTRDGQRVRPGDWIQFRYRSPSPLHLMVVGFNQKQEIFAYLPLQGTQSLRVPAGQKRLPEKALELDDTLGRELFLMIVSREPFSLSSVKRHLKLPPGWRQASKMPLHEHKLASTFWRDKQVKTVFINKRPRPATRRSQEGP